LIVAVATVAVLGAAVLPEVASSADRELAVRTYAQLADLDSGIMTFGTLVKRVGTVYPGAIHQLTNPLTTSDKVSCQNNTMNSNAIKLWNQDGAFSTQYITSAGLYTPIGTVNDLIEHASGSAPMYLRIPAVDTGMLTRMDGLVDGGDGGGAGTILYTTSTASTADLVYRVGFAPNYTLTGHC
jgi:type II secretory pathway pseudopilin PulG